MTEADAVLLRAGLEQIFSEADGRFAITNRAMHVLIRRCFILWMEAPEKDAALQNWGTFGEGLHRAMLDAARNRGSYIPRNGEMIPLIDEDIARAIPMICGLPPAPIIVPGQ